MDQEQKDLLISDFVTNALDSGSRRELFLESLEDDELFAALDELAPAELALRDEKLVLAMERAQSHQAIFYSLGRAYRWGTHPKVLLPAIAAAGTLGLAAIAASFFLGRKLASLNRPRSQPAR